MGYQDIDLYKLKFEGRDGLEVSAEGLSTGDLLDVMDLMAKLPDKATAAATALDPEMRGAVMTLMEVFAGSVAEWNILDRAGQPVPVSVTGLKSLKLTLVMDMITAWIGAQTDVDEDLGKDSGSGTTSAPEPSLPMVPLSPSPGS